MTQVFNKRVHGTPATRWCGHCDAVTDHREAVVYDAATGRVWTQCTLCDCVWEPGGVIFMAGPACVAGNEIYMTRFGRPALVAEGDSQEEERAELAGYRFGVMSH